MRVRVYIFLEAILFAGVLLMQALDKRTLEDLLIYLCIVVNTLYVLCMLQKNAGKDSTGQGRPAGRCHPYTDMADGSLDGFAPFVSPVSEETFPACISPLLPCMIMLLTLCADTFLVLLDRCRHLGVFLFCIVQLLYAGVLYERGHAIEVKDHAGKKLSVRKSKTLLPGILFRGTLFLLPAWMLMLYESSGTIVSSSSMGSSGMGSNDMGSNVMDGITMSSFAVNSNGAGFALLLSLLAVFSFSQLMVNVLCAARISRKTQLPADRLMFAGLFFFLCCDLCVGLRNLPVPGSVSTVAYAVNWLFYIPSQVLLSAGLVRLAGAGGRKC